MAGPQEQSPEPIAWLRSPAADLLIGCGAWTLPLLLLNHFLSNGNIISTSFVFYFLTLFCNNPHYMATIYRAYGTATDFSKYRVFTVYVTAMMLLAALLVHWAPVLLPLLFTIYLTYSPWHYTGQNFGVAMVFLRRNNVSPSRSLRAVLKWAFTASYGMWFLSMHSVYASDPRVMTLGIPEGWALAGRVTLLFVFLSLGLYGFVNLADEGGLRRVFPALVMYSTQFLWFVFPTLLELATGTRLPPGFYSTGVLAFMHCAQYLWITSYYARRETEQGLHGAQKAWHPVAYYMAMVVGGIVLFVPGPWIVSRVLRYDFVQSFLIFTALVNIHHFILDGAIWKLRDGRIARLLLGGGSPDHTNTDHEPESMIATIIRRLMGPEPWARSLRIACTLGLVFVALVDQRQYFLTLDTTDWSGVRKAIEANPSDSRAYKREAQLLADAGDTSAALAAAEQAIHLNPRGDAQFLLGTLLLRGGLVSQAYEHYRQQEKLVRPDLSTFVNTGVLAAQAGDLESASQKLEAALSIDPSNREALASLAEVRLQQKRPTDSVHLLELLLRDIQAGGLKAQGDRALAARAGMRLGNAYAVLGKPELAKLSFQNAGKIADAAGLGELSLQARKELESIQ
ncbi:MAG: tetratricopeptide repeat protein [Candidatus Sumerlaeaceae bacterium]|nr:tetratricopeptide repeat protein [Candidatus Sumerlaeaceae bacterium]